MFIFFQNFSDARVSLKHGSYSPQTLGKRASDHSQFFIFRRQKKIDEKLGLKFSFRVICFKVSEELEAKGPQNQFLMPSMFQVMQPLSMHGFMLMKVGISKTALVRRGPVKTFLGTLAQVHLAIR